MDDGEFDEALIDSEADEDLEEDEIPEGFHDVDALEPESDF